ncbi:MAG: hypothetical protein ABF747_02580 [Bifidobacterium sp.]|uniref:Uncharacterized protein n=1 Tax=Bifidobacterium fermentum TaxID=3059035 RepID=A0AB39UHU8_9BIFI
MKVIQQRSSQHAASRRRPDTFIDIDSLPGPLSMRYLSTLRIVTKMDDHSCFSNENLHTLYGRASIAARLVPIGAAACTYLARWIWSGGKFPGTIDIISNSHFRAAVHGHLIRVNNRRIGADHMVQIGTLLLTSPTRTACDIACNEDTSESFNESVETISRMLELYDVEPEECMELLIDNQRWPGHAKGLEIMRMIVFLSGSRTLRTHMSHGSGKAHVPEDEIEAVCHDGPLNEHGSGTNADAAHMAKRMNGRIPRSAPTECLAQARQ